MPIQTKKRKPKKSLKNRSSNKAPKLDKRSSPDRRPIDPEMSPAELKKILAPLKEAAKFREEYKTAYKEYVLASQLAAIKASEADVPLRLIVEAGLFTRQYFYQIERDYKAGKLNGNRPKLGRPPQKHKTLKEYEEEANGKKPKPKIKSKNKIKPKAKTNPMLRKKVKIRSR